MFKFTLTITTSAFLFMSGTADLFAMEPLFDDHDTKSLATIDRMPKDIMQEMSKHVNPRHLITICKHWYSVMREGNIPQGAELHYSTMNPFMQKCMNTYWENLFYNGILQYTPTDGSKGVTSKFSGLKDKDGTFDLSTCGDTGKYLVITTNMDRFFKIQEENKDKTVILITPRSLVEQRTAPDHPFATHMAGWDADNAPVGMFWRWGNDKNLAWVDSLTTEKMMGISACNLFENWRKSARSHAERSPWRDGGTRRGGVFMSIFEPK
jgi:hypothetical protein